jgi:uncharacterized protein YndB with AHSA1/START domain
MAASNAKSSAPEPIEEREFVITREFDAPRELVFKAWTESERLKHRWRPKRFTWVSGKKDGSPNRGRLPLRHAIAGRARAVGQIRMSRNHRANAAHFHQFVCRRPEQYDTRPIFRHLAAGSIEFVDVHRAGGQDASYDAWHSLQPTETERKTFKDTQKGMQQGFKGTLAQLDDYLAKVKV